MRRNFFLICGVIVGVLFFLSFRTIWVEKIATHVFSPTKSGIVLNPPSGAVSGTILNIKGQVKKQGRDDDNFKPIGTAVQFIQGESLATETGSAIISFSNFFSATVSGNTEIAFIDGMPQEFLLQQKSGKVTYELLDETKSISIRSLHALIQISGKATVTSDSDNQTTIVEMQFGNGKIGMNDTDENTHVYQLAQGQKAMIDDTKRTVDIE